MEQRSEGQEGDERPVLYYHGTDPSGEIDPKPEIIGKAKVARIDEKGLWFEVVLDKAKKYAERIWKAAVNGFARASTGSINYLVRRSPDREILVWPVGELTLLDQGQGRFPANDMATVSLKAIFAEAEIEMPKTFSESGELKGNVTQEKESGGDNTFGKRLKLFAMDEPSKEAKNYAEITRRK